jgi:hypothetical protein
VLTLMAATHGTPASDGEDHTNLFRENQAIKHTCPSVLAGTSLVRLIRDNHRMREIGRLSWRGQ